jgi:hypothetical protein
LFGAVCGIIWWNLGSAATIFGDISSLIGIVDLTFTTRSISAPPRRTDFGGSANAHAFRRPRPLVRGNNNNWKDLAMVEVVPLELPDFGGLDEPLPQMPVSEYERRLGCVVARMKEAHLDFLVVYGDREHCANMAFLSGFDPRFEEALLLLDLTGRRWLLVGNECMGYLPDAKLKCEPVMFQEFSLMGQPRGNSRVLRAIFADFGIARGASVGCAGWKYFEGLLV